MALKMKGEKAFQIAWEQLLDELPFFGMIMFQLQVGVDRSIPTACTNGLWLVYNPEWLETLDNLKQVKFIICHEIAHVLDEHPFRIARFKWEHMTANIAGDHLVNLMLQKVKEGIIEMPPNRMLADPRFEGKVIEEIYNILVREEQQSGGMGQGEQGDTGNGDASDSASGSGNVAGNDPGEMGSFEAAGTDINGKQLSPDEIKEKLEKLRDTIETAAKIAKRSGKSDCELAESMLARLTVKENWSTILASYLKRVFLSKYSWSRGNRRFLYRGMYLPSRRSKGSGNVGFFIDTSGSVSDYFRGLFDSHANKALAQCEGLRVYLVYFTHRVNSAEWKNHRDIPLDFSRTQYGGTDPGVVFDAIKRDRIDLDAIVVLTDMEFDASEIADPGIPVLWCYPSNIEPYARPSFGRMLPISPDSE